MAAIEIVMEGDSWERLPDFGVKGLPIIGGSNYDMARGLTDLGFKVHNLAYWGDTIADIVKAKDYLSGLRQTDARVLVLGGGGNDLLGGGRLSTYLNLYEPDISPEDCLKPQFDSDLGKVMLDYEIALHDIAGDPEIAATQVFVHGYDYAHPMELGWLGKPMTLMGYDRHKDTLRAAIVKTMMDRFNTRLKALEAAWDNVHYVDFRTMVGDRWHDELHPEKSAFADLAGYLAKKIKRAVKS